LVVAGRGRRVLQRREGEREREREMKVVGHLIVV
jgi:hypothetical protein